LSFSLFFPSRDEPGIFLEIDYNLNENDNPGAKRFRFFFVGSFL